MLIYKVTVFVLIVSNVVKSNSSDLRTAPDPIWYLSKFGYLNKYKPLSTKPIGSMRMASLSVNKNYSIEGAVRKFQKYAGLNQTGQLNNETLNMMRLPRCGRPDNLSKAEQLRKQHRSKRFVLQGSKWSKSKILFRIAKYPKFSSMSPEDIDREINRAFNLWSEVSDLEFEQLKEPALKELPFYHSGSDRLINRRDKREVDIDVRFETGYHGDAEPFDGSGLILGHAYFPEFGGSTHFDSDEFWTTKADEGVDLYQVAVHEFGHALGLEHSDNYKAIMAPFFRGYMEDFRLHSDDMKAIQMLYGIKKRKSNTDKSSKKSPSIMIKVATQTSELTTELTTTTESTSTSRPTTKHATTSAITRRITLTTTTTTTITTRTTTITMKKTTTTTNLTFKPNKMIKTEVKYSPKSNIQSSFDKHICLDGKFDAISVLSDNYTYVFKGKYLYRIDSDFVMDPSYPKLISKVFRDWSTTGIQTLPQNLDTVLYLPDNGITFFFKDDMYWRSSRLFDLEPGYPKFISESFIGLNAANGFLGKLDASFVWGGNMLTYMVQGDNYWRFNFQTGSIDSGYPKKLAFWTGLPPQITDAFLWINGITYFFDNEMYYRFNDYLFRVEDAVSIYPRYNLDTWFNCREIVHRQNFIGSLIKTKYLATNKALDAGLQLVYSELNYISPPTLLATSLPKTSPIPSSILLPIPVPTTSSSPLPISPITNIITKVPFISWNQSSLIDILRSNYGKSKYVAELKQLSNNSSTNNFIDNGSHLSSCSIHSIFLPLLFLLIVS